MAFYYSKKWDDGSMLAIWEIEETEEELLKLSAVPHEELEELRHIGNEKRRKERLAVRALLHHVFGEKVYLSYYENGRPFLQNSIVELSIAHTQRFAAIFTHPYDNVGVDIESLQRDFSAVENKALSEEEKEYLSERQRSLHLAILWCAKEAIYKLMSRHDVDFAKQIHIEKFSPKEKGSIDAHFYQKDGEDIELEVYYKVFDDHVAAWVLS
jgi:Phosphopantetheinyl transferase